jgi:hypothetical protein
LWCRPCSWIYLDKSQWNDKFIGRINDISWFNLGVRHFYYRAILLWFYGDIAETYLLYPELTICLLERLGVRVGWMGKQALSMHNSYLEEVNAGLDILWDTAKRIVDQTLSFQPDVVVCLLHSGWAPLKAALMLWEATQNDPFPAVAKTNLGREKYQAYQVGNKTVGTGNFLGYYSDPFQISHFLAWLSKQSSWHAELKAQIQGQLGAERDPGRIMIVDDWIADGNTYILALGLMEILYPQAQTRFVAGDLGWKAKFDRLWLELFHPCLLAKINQARDEDGIIDGEMRVLVSNTSRLIPGTEDVEPGSFAWQMVSVSSPTIQKLSYFLPAEEWLDLPQFVNKTIEDYIAERIHEYKRGKIESQLHGRLKKGDFFPKLSIDTLILRDLWLDEGGITRRQIIQKYKLSAGQAYRLLQYMIRQGNLVKVGRGRSTHYSLSPWRAGAGRS